MKKLQILKSALVGGASVLAMVHPAAAKQFDIADGDLAAVLSNYMQQSGVQIFFVDDAVRGHKSPGAKGDYTETAALSQILRGTGFTAQTMPSSNAIDIVPQQPKPAERVAQAAPRTPAPPAQTGVETIVVTAQKKSEDIQQVPISVTALSQHDLTNRQIAAGPDLIRDVPNMNFGKTNFSGYSIELRGIGTQAISVTTDPAVAVAYNGTPFIRNHFFEQEFFDLDNIEVLRGPQGTLYGRNATAGVVNLIPALPTDQFEAMGSVDIGNYMERRLEGMINLPIVGDQLDIRVAGEWTKRSGYTDDTTLSTDVDGRDLWSGRVTIGFKPTEDLQTYLVWEHFSEDDDRLRSGKQLCATSNLPTTVDGVAVPPPGSYNGYGGAFDPSSYLSQGCEAASLYSPQSFEVPYGSSLPYVKAAELAGALNPSVNPYASATQSSNLRQVEMAFMPHYLAKNDLIEFNAEYRISSSLTLTSQTGYNNDYLYSTEDFNRFDTSPGIFSPNLTLGNYSNVTNSQGVFCDPQVGCSNRLVAEDLNDENSWQFSQEFRLASNFSGPFNFNIGGNYLHYATEENYYVFINALTLYTLSSEPIPTGTPYIPGVSDNHQCLLTDHYYYVPLNPAWFISEPSVGQCNYIDPNPIGNVNNEGHNYFLSQNPYFLNSYAVFGETYYNIEPNLKLTTGLRFTDDQKTFFDIPSELLTNGWGYFQTGTVRQSWDRLTGRAVLDWTPQLDFTDQSLFYASYSHGYKAGGANPPGAALLGGNISTITFPDHPLTFKPEYIEALELGTKNTLLDGSLTLNGDIFYYNYTGYQISEIVDRTAINNNYNAHVEGAEIESNWEPLPGLKFNFAGGWEDTAAAGGDNGIDLIDRTAGTPGWMVVKPYPTQASNCILPDYLVAALLQNPDAGSGGLGLAQACGVAYNLHFDPLTQLAYVPNPTVTASGYAGPGSGFNPYIPSGYPGFNPLTAPNNGEGFSKNLTGHALPNAPPFTVSLGSQYTIPVLEDWAATLRADFYWQADSWARIFNDNPYDRLDGYTNVNLALIFASDDGWQVMGYVKNVFNVTAITGDFLNSDDTGLTTNVFLTDPRLYGVRVTKNFGEGDTGAMGDVENWLAGLFSDASKTKPNLWITLGGQLEQQTGQGDSYDPPFVANYPNSNAFKSDSPLNAEKPPLFSEGEEAAITFQPDGSDWVISASVRYGRANKRRIYTHLTEPTLTAVERYYTMPPSSGLVCCQKILVHPNGDYADVAATSKTSHAVIDFDVGQDVGLGMLGLDGTSTISAGLRFAQFQSAGQSTLRAIPDATFDHNAYGPFILKLYPSAFIPTANYHVFGDATQSKRSFHGVGPSISWNGSLAVVNVNDTAGLSVDWGANGALLFGRRKASGEFSISGHYHQYNLGNIHFYNSHGNFTRGKEVVVPNLGGFAGLSFNYRNAKVSFGYRGDFFFGAMDTGWDQAHSNNVGLFGPYANLSIGF